MERLLGVIRVAIPLLLSFPPSSTAFYLPGVAPSSYDAGELVPLHVNSLTPALTDDGQLHALVAFDYYDSNFRLCRPEEGPQWIRESLGSIVFGDRIRTSPFELHMAQNESCKVLCEKKVDPKRARFINHKIGHGYEVNFLVDGLPAAQEFKDPLADSTFWRPGFPLGALDKDESLALNNHWHIVIDYHEAGLTGDQYRVVGVAAQPESYRKPRTTPDESGRCGNPSDPLILNEKIENTVTWTYSVDWRPSDTAWATRWDKYLHVYDPKIHWFSLINSACFVVLLVVMVSIILLRALRKDIERYNRISSFNLDDLSGTSGNVDEDVQEDSGWKLVHGDVFRSPRYPMLLSVLLGSGVQAFVMVGFTLLFALLGFLSPSNRGLLGTVILLVYTVLGFLGGYVSARTYKTFGGERWKLNIILTPSAVPGIVFATFFLLNLWMWAKKSSGAVPLTTMLAIVAIWFFISVPLSSIGSWLAFRKPPIIPPTKVNQIPRQIPPCAPSLRLLPSLFMTGILPFAAIFVEVYFVIQSLWTSMIYYMFGFLFLSYGLMVITTACSTVLLVYFLLCAEDYRWHWRAFLGAGMTGAYVFAMALTFWTLRISVSGLTGAVLYIGYSFLLGFLSFVLTGQSQAFPSRRRGKIGRFC